MELERASDFIKTLSIPQAKGVKFLWHSGYYDGPLSGMALWEGKHYWFECEFDYGWREIRDPIEIQELLTTFNKTKVEDLDFCRNEMYYLDWDTFRQSPPRLMTCEPRIFILQKLSPLKYLLEWFKHKLFQTFVGTHTDYSLVGENKRELGKGLKDGRLWKVFYITMRLFPKRLFDHSKAKQIAWFVR